MASGKRTAEADCKPGGGGRHSLAYMGSRLRARAAKQSFLFLDGLEMIDGRLRGKVLSTVNSQLKDFSPLMKQRDHCGWTSVKRAKELIEQGLL